MNQSRETSNVITRQSLNMLAGDENDLLSESPVFTKAKARGEQQQMAMSQQQMTMSQGGPFDIAPKNNNAEEFEEIDE